MSEDAGDLAGADAGGGSAARRSPGRRSEGRLVKRENYRHSVGTCERCHTRIEPLDLAAVVVQDEGTRRSPRLRRCASVECATTPSPQQRFAITLFEDYSRLAPLA